MAQAKKTASKSAATSRPSRPVKSKKAAPATPTAGQTLEKAALSGDAKSAPGDKADLKERFAALANATGRLTTLKRSLEKNFFDVGLILNEIRAGRLYEVKGYGSFESFVERELDINKVTCLRSARIAEAMHRSIALEAGLDRASAAVAALDGEVDAAPSAVHRGGNHTVPLVPLHKQ